MLVTLNEVLRDAQKNKYAVGLFNTINLEMAKGVLEAAEEMKSPVIIGTAEVLLPVAGLAELASFLIPMAKKASVPVVFHFDHGLTEQKIFEALKLGFTSIMYDCSMDSYEVNIEKVKQITKTAHGFGASVEAELGHVGSNDGSAEGTDDDHSIYTDSDQAREFYTGTSVDALAVAIGNAHGQYKAKPKLDLDVLKKIASNVPCPLVLHGGSGLSDDDFRNCIQNGISKVNIFTDINIAAARATAEHYREGIGLSDLSPVIAAAVKDETIKKIKLFNSQNRG